MHRILTQKDSRYPLFREFYAVSFPVHELRNEQQQMEALSDDRYHLDCYVEDNRLMAFIAYWDFQTYYYIEHFAVHPDFRGQSIGSKILSEFMAVNDLPVLLEIDPVVDEISAKRFRFYQQLGFVENPYEHFHPAYDKCFKPHHLTVLTAPKAISTEEYERFYGDLRDIVMG